ncbi:hypothetical protein Tco_1442636 [Tanacetum coccineum]
MLTSCYLLNRVPTKRSIITPYKLWTKRKPNLNYLKVWGCRAVVRILDPKLKLWVKEALNASLLDMLSIPRLLVPRPSQRSLINGTEDISGSVVPKEVTEEVVAQQPEPELRKGKRDRTPKNFGPEFKLYSIGEQD